MKPCKQAKPAMQVMKSCCNPSYQLRLSGKAVAGYLRESLPREVSEATVQPSSARISNRFVIGFGEMLQRRAFLMTIR